MLLIHSGITADIHDHGDGAISNLEIAEDLYKMSGLKFPFPGYKNLDDLHQKIKAWYADPYADIIGVFNFLTNVMQNPDTIHSVFYQYVKVRAGQKQQYREVMFAPHYHTRGDKISRVKLTKKEVLDAAIQGIKDGEKEHPEIEVNILVALGRELRPKKAIRVLKVIEKCDRNYVVGFNLVCNEQRYPPERHIKTYDYAAAAEINADCHTAEWVRRPKQKPDFERDLPKLKRNLRAAFTKLLAPKNRQRDNQKIRAGHCIPLAYDPEMMRFAIDNNIGISFCPLSNLQGGNIPRLEALRLTKVLDHQISASLGADDDLFMPGLDQVRLECDKIYHFTEEQKVQLIVGPWNMRFGNRKPVPPDILAYL